MGVKPRFADHNPEAMSAALAGGAAGRLCVLRKSPRNIETARARGWPAVKGRAKVWR